MANTQAALRYREHWKSAAELQLTHQESAPNYLTAQVLNSLLPSGIRCGTILEISGQRSAGRTAISWYILAQATGQGQICAVVDLHDSFHPASAAVAGVRLESLVWARCGGNMEHAMRACDLLLHAGGFGVIHLDLCEADSRSLNKVPLSYWHRFRRAVENTSTVLLVCADSPQAKACALNNLQAKSKAVSWAGEDPFSVLTGLHTEATLGKVALIRPHPLLVRAAV